MKKEMQVLKNMRKKSQVLYGISAIVQKKRDDDHKRGKRI